MKAPVLLSLFLLLLIPLVAADFTLDTPADNALFGTSDTVTFTGQCDEAGQFAVQIFAGHSTVEIAEVAVSGGSYTWSTSTLADGNYTSFSWCGSTIERSFCKGDSCRSTTVIDTTEDTTEDTSSSGRGSSGSSCRPEWSCSAWSYCSNTLERSRDCVDLNNCRRASSPSEVQSCSVCDESWTCSLWSECSGGTNVRTCLDEHHCGSVLTKPILTKSCSVTVPSGVQPTNVNTGIPPPTQTTPYTAQPNFFKTLWENYPIFLIAIPIAILLIILMSVYLLHHIHKHKPAINEDQLHTYIREELAGGMSEEEARQNLQKAGWNDQEISQAFSSMNNPAEQMPPVNPNRPLY